MDFLPKPPSFSAMLSHSAILVLQKNHLGSRVGILDANVTINQVRSTKVVRCTAPLATLPPAVAVAPPPSDPSAQRPVRWKQTCRNRSKVDWMLRSWTNCKDLLDMFLFVLDLSNNWNGIISPKKTTWNLRMEFQKEASYYQKVNFDNFQPFSVWWCISLIRFYPLVYLYRPLRIPNPEVRSPLVLQSYLSKLGW